MQLIHLFLEFLNNLKVYHWRTMSYARHKASDDCFQKLQALIDQFVEVCTGKHGRKALLEDSKSKCSAEIAHLTDKSVVPFVTQFRMMLEHLQIADSDLANIRDEMVAELNQCLYLFTLKN
jgi:hypothetical protein